MLDALTQYVLDRRNGLTRAASYAGSAYLATKYVARSLQETRDAMLHDRIAREKYVNYLWFLELWLTIDIVYAM